MKIKIVAISLLLVAAFGVTGCGMIDTFTGTKGGTVSNLWTDVPPLPNATKADISIPPLVNLMIQGFVQAANADNSNDTRLDKFDFIGYQTADTPQQVSEFYTAEKMKAAGWTAEDTGGCQVSAGEGVAGGFCAFGKTEGNSSTVLLILPVQDSNTKQTQVFFIRFQGTKK